MPPRAATSLTSEALLDALARSGWERLGAALAGAVADAGDGFDAHARPRPRLRRLRDPPPALIELMFATKHADNASPDLAQAGERAFAPALATVADGQAAGAVVPGDPHRVAIVAFAALQGLVALANNEILDGTPLTETLDEVIERLVLGLRPR